MAYSETRSGMGSSLAGPMLSSLAENWWLLLLRGIVAIGFGVVAFYVPGLTRLSLTLLWGAYAFADGIFALWAAVSGEGAKTSSRWWLGAIGVVDIAASVTAFLWPGMTAFVLLMFIAGWAIASGAFQIYGAIQLRKEIQDEWLLILGGLLSIGFGLLLFAQPASGAVALIWTIGVFAILNGFLYVALAFRVKTYKTAG
jgi:uncharacterized membrane protein HdeD (DUF308 family)